MHRLCSTVLYVLSEDYVDVRYHTFVVRRSHLNIYFIVILFFLMHLEILLVHTQ